MTKIKLTTEARKAVQSFAVRYQAYVEAMERFGEDATEENARSLRMWARMLRERQRELGIEIATDATLDWTEESTTRFLNQLERTAQQAAE